MNKTPHICTIKQLAEETSISQHTIRCWVKQGAFKSLRSGKKYLINYDIFMKFLEGTEEHTTASTQPYSYEIRKVVG